CEGKPLLAETLLMLQAGGAMGRQPLLPEIQGVGGYGKSRRGDLSGTWPTVCHSGKGEIGHDRARRTDFVAIVEMVDIGRVEIHRLLYAPQPERLGEETVVDDRVARKRRDVMNASYLIEHEIESSPGRSAPSPSAPMSVAHARLERWQSQDGL